MKLLVAGVVTLSLIVVGLFAVAMLSSSREVAPSPDQDTQVMVAGVFDPSPTVMPVPTNLPLGPDKQMEVWNSEHAAFQIERRFGRAFCDALFARDEQQLAGFFTDSFAGTSPQPANSTELQHAAVHRVVRQFEEGTDPASAADTVQAFLTSIEKIKTCSYATLSVLSLNATEQSVWQARVALEAHGETEEGKPCELQSIHRVEFLITEEAKIDKTASIKSWVTEEEVWQFGERSLMEESTELGQNMTLRVFDNWGQQQRTIGVNLQPKRVPPHRFQTSVADYDNDGDPDIAVVDGTKRVILRNDDGQFVYATRLLEMRDQTRRSTAPAIAWLDFDNDGYMDLFSADRLYHSVDGQKMEDVSLEAGLSLLPGPGGASVCDFDCDGLVDIYIPLGVAERPVSWVTNTAGRKNQLWRNKGGGVFEEVADAANASGGERNSTAAVWLFANDDHYPDLFVTNDLTESVLLLNNGDGTFDDVSQSIHPTRLTGFSGGATTGDLNNDGRPDLYLSALYSIPGNRVTERISKADYEKEGTFERIQDLCSGNRLYQFGKSSELIDITESAGVGKLGSAWGGAMFDIDNDGWLDLYGTSGYRSTQLDRGDGDTCVWRRIVSHPHRTAEAIPRIGALDTDGGEFWAMDDQVMNGMRHNLGSFERNRLFLNQQGTGFLDASFASSADVVSDSRAAIPADFNGDGAVDLLVASAGGGSLRLFLNQMPQGHRVKIRLVGSTSNRFGIGSRVIATVGDRQIVRDLFPGVGFMSSGPSEIWIGLGEAETIDELSVRWPTGEVQKFENVAADQSIELHEGDSEVKVKAAFK